jgi:hypothetical protein
MATTTATPERTGDLPPPKLIAGYGNSHLMGWIVVALIIHGVIIGATSVNYLRDMFDPAGAEARRQAVEAAKAPPTAPPKAGAATPAPGGAAPAGTTQQSTSAPTAKSTTTSPDSEAAQAEKTKSTQVMKNLSDTAKPNELPKKPDDLGIGLDETNPK